MKTEIERIITCDEEGRGIIKRSKEDANALINKADLAIEAKRKEIKSILDNFRKSELAHIIKEAKAQAQKTIENTKDYCAILEDRFHSRQEQLKQDIKRLLVSNFGIK